MPPQAPARQGYTVGGFGDYSEPSKMAESMVPKSEVEKKCAKAVGCEEAPALRSDMPLAPSLEAMGSAALTHPTLAAKRSSARALSISSLI